MSVKFVVGYDGSPESQRAAAFAVERAREAGAEILLAHVLEWSPYSFLTPEEIEERHKRRSEELSRAEAFLIKPFLRKLQNPDVKIESVIKYGHVADTLADITSTSGATQMFIGRAGDTGLSGRVFGSVAASLAQTAPVPCTIVP